MHSNQTTEGPPGALSVGCTETTPSVTACPLLKGLIQAIGEESDQVP
jgi:hypothetical protein